MGTFSMGKKLWVIKAAIGPHVWYFPPSHLSPIYTTQKNGSVPCFYEMGPDSLFSGFGAIGGYGPKTEKKRIRTPFPDRKRCVNASSFRTIRTFFFMWACRALRWFRACALFLYTMASMVSKTQKTKTIVWTDEEVGLLLDVFAEETIQIGLEKAKCPKDKNAVYLEVQEKLEQRGKFLC